MRLRQIARGHPYRNKLTTQLNAVLTHVTHDRADRIDLAATLFERPFLTSTLDLCIGDVKAFNRFAYNDGLPNDDFIRYMRGLL